ncbi:unnamed protein product [Toxocara canis]|uniref:Uncharacterized protein n=1 Tax=Toxocara canis TaxID=6265 RepID=A0A183US35_TOXCA|nr:unnamed protein product [Toxocara canis]
MQVYDVDQDIKAVEVKAQTFATVTPCGPLSARFHFAPLDRRVGSTVKARATLVVGVLPTSAQASRSAEYALAEFVFVINTVRSHCITASVSALISARSCRTRPLGEGRGDVAQYMEDTSLRVLVYKL